MGMIAGLQVHFHLGLPDGQVAPRMLVIDIHDIGPVFFDVGNETPQLAGPVGQMGQQLDAAAGFHQAVFDDTRDHVDVDIAAADNSRSLIGMRDIAVQHGGQADSARAFADHFGTFHHQQDRRRDIVVFDDKNIIDIFLDQVESSFARRFYGDTIGNSMRFRSLYPFAGMLG